MVTVVAKPQRQGLNNGAAGFTTTAAAQQQWQLFHDNDGGSTMMAVAQRQRRRLHDNGGGSLRRWLHTDWMVVRLKLDDCCLYCALSNSVIVYRNFLILDGNS